MDEELQWRCNTKNLLQEILHNPGAYVLNIPIKLFAVILFEVAERASEINDPQLNALMCRLQLYETSDPDHPNYDSELTEKTIREGQALSAIKGEEKQITRKNQ